jgi:hypothetical protein
MNHYTRLSDAVVALERERKELEDLAGEMLATLLLEKNKEYIPEKLRDFARQWRVRFRRITVIPAHKGKEIKENEDESVVDS